ncbi:low temperature requirement protein A [Baekduia soli]|uniref:Low temperature requirement protein A n=1 Tax=Baekduia soli TaxID=496014 RepID=A0A5B8UBY9_9ACTN|nr:low temperature requirement protein A [Baekduia soli]QEC50504.1 low temperature requirement protein A [Baekduia soli]
MAAAPSRTPDRLRARDGGEQEITAVELFFDLVYVFAVTQLSHLLLDDLTWAGAGRAVFLLAVVWWAWIYTTWMVNWFDPRTAEVRAVMLGAMFASLLMAAALPEAFTRHGLLFAAAYVVLQVGRNGVGMVLLDPAHPLRRNFERMLAWSVAAAVLWLAGALLLDGDRRLLLWGPALAIDVAAPLARYWIPGRGTLMEMGHPLHGGHFAERFQGFIIIALGESIVVTGATAAEAGLTATVVLTLFVAFLETAALWWLYFGLTADGSLRLMREHDDAVMLARDAYTYLHLPIIAGVILAAVGDDLLIAHPHEALSTAGALVVVLGPVLFLAGELAFRWRMIAQGNPPRLVAVVVLLVLLAPATAISALAISAIVTALLTLLGFWELWAINRRRAAAAAPGTAA